MARAITSRRRCSTNSAPKSIAVGNEPDGLNINAKVGATHPRYLQAAVVEHGADLGIALDGDGDRLVMVDAEGRVYDGDQLLYVIALDYWRRGAMTGGIVGTLMSNLGFEQALTRRGIEFARAAVGDRYVLELMQQKKWMLGGENSGHIICLDKHTTGDAIVAALAVLRSLREQKTTLAAMTSDAPLFPQRLINVPIRRGFEWGASDAIQRAEREAVAVLRRFGPCAVATVRHRVGTARHGRSTRRRRRGSLRQGHRRSRCQGCNLERRPRKRVTCCTEHGFPLARE